MVKIRLKQVSQDEHLGRLICYEKTTGEKITIHLPTLGEDGVHLYHNGKIEIGGCRPSIEYFTDNPPKTDEVVINIDGWLYVFYEVVIEVEKDFTYVAFIPIK